MIPQSRLQEFGFPDADRFPRRLIQHAVTMSLPSAMDNGLDPIEVVIEDGLVVPLQSSGSSGGMIIRNDGAMLRVGHRRSGDPKSPLESQFIREIPYDIRVTVAGIMRRAVLADPSLVEIWGKVSAAWTAWFQNRDGEENLRLAGDFPNVTLAWIKTGELLKSLIEQLSRNGADQDRVQIKVVVQSEAEFGKGWLGEELPADETSLRAILRQGRVKYLLQAVFPAMQQVLRNPMFSAGSTVRLYHGSRHAYLVKWVIVPSGEQGMRPAGIELPASALDGLAPLQE